MKSLKLRDSVAKELEKVKKELERLSGRKVSYSDVIALLLNAYRVTFEKELKSKLK